MRLALLQAAGTPGDVEANLAAVAGAADAAAGAGAALLITPECFATGYAIGAERIHALAEPLDGPLARRLGALARRAGVALLAGLPVRAGDAVYNTAVLWDRAGEQLASCRKTHLYGDVDALAFAPGDELVVAELDGVRVGLLVCFDVEFPEAVRALARRGAQLVAVPTSLMAPYDAVTRTLVPARAAENQVFVAYANRVGSEGDLVYVGQSCVVGPDGADVARAGREEETVLVADVDLGAVARARAGFSYLEGLRPELYG